MNIEVAAFTVTQKVNYTQAGYRVNLGKYRQG